MFALYRNAFSQHKKLRNFSNFTVGGILFELSQFAYEHDIQ